MPRALITGITGQDGSILAEQLVAEGAEVLGLARPPLDREVANLAAVRDRVTLLPGDLLDAASLRRAVAEAQPDELYHLGAPTFVPASWDDPAETVAAVAGATATLLAAAVALERPPRVFVATSSEVFGDAGVSPQDEESRMRPRTPYGVAKLAAHRLVGVMRERHGLHASTGIAFNHESPRRPEAFLPRKVSRGVAAVALGLERELVLGSLDAVRDWCAARDVTRGAVLAARHPEPGDYVLASGVGRTVRELVATAFAHVGLAPDGRVRVDPALV
ncbi:MAG: GDP-mannose 4,6-dehydratase, partial [Actinomycetota bacterium]|nr:GDP-mannose 4,6-dehydratase [Actinomycetota bacterium]